MRNITVGTVLGFAATVACVACAGAPAPQAEAPASASASAADAKSSVPGGEAAKPTAGDESAPSTTRASMQPGASAAAPSAQSEALAVPQGDDPWLASHQMSPKDVLVTVRPLQSRFQACFNTAKKRDPSVSGEVKVRFVIANDGTVRDWKDDGSSMSDEDVTHCVGEVVQRLKFPKQLSPGDAWGSYSINFTP